MTWFYKHPSGDAYYNDVEESACAWLRELMIAGQIAPGVVDNRSILDVQPTDLIGFTQCHFFAGIGGWSLALRLAGWPDNRPVWTGSPPCQPFSVAGEGKGKDDERHLAPKFISLVRACRPGVLFGEQVASSAVFGKAAKGRRGAPASAPDWAWIDDLSDRLEAARYAAWAVDFPSAGVGAPHIRQRTYFGAVDALRMANAHVGRQCGDNRGGGTGVAEEACGGMLCPDGAVSLGGMADHHGDGCDQGRERVSATGHDGVERDGSAGGVGNPGRARGETWISEPPQREEGEPEVPDNGMRGLSGPDAGRSHSGGLADTNCTTGREDARGTPCDENAHGAAGRDRGEPDTDHRFASDGENRRTSTPDSFWSDPDWLFCRDGKWRPVEPSAQQMADGLSAGLGCLRLERNGGSENGEESETDPGAVLQELRNQDGTAAHEWPFRRPDSVPEAGLLLPGVHGGRLRGHGESGEPEEQPKAVSQNQKRELREMRTTGAPRPPQGSQPDEQRPRQFGKLVRFLSQEGTPPPGCYPLARGVTHRAKLLRGYGNAINPQQAAVFIEESAQALAEAGPLRVTYGMAIDSLEVFG